MSGARDISVLVPTYRRRDAVLRLLEGLRRQTLDPSRFEAVVVIDGTHDGTEEALSALDTPFALLWRWQENTGISGARNAAAALAGGRVLLLLDDDMLPEPGLLAGHLARHEGAARCCVIGASPLELLPGQSPIARDVAREFDEHHRRLAERPDDPETFDLYGGNFSVSRGIFGDVGGFGTGFDGYGWEDVDFMLRVREAGGVLRYSPSAVAVQSYDKDVAAVARDAVQEGTNAAVLVARHPQAWAELRRVKRAVAPGPWRVTRTALIAITRRAPRTFDALVSMTRWLERARFPRMTLCYRLLLEYCFWLGAGDTLERRPAPIPPPTPAAHV
jgi:glycosyltransferase involved in cell wall biosynthesis